MGRLIRYELKKIISPAKFTVLLTAAALLCIGVFCLTCAQTNAEIAKEYQILYRGDVLTGPVSQAVARERFLREKGDTVGLTDEEYEEFESLEEAAHLNRCDEVRKMNLAEYGIQPKTLVVGDTISYGFTERFISTYLPLILCFMLAFLLGPVFASEYESRMDGLVLASQNGKRKVIYAKIISAVVVTVACFIIIMGIYSAITVAVWGLSDSNASFVFSSDVFTYLSSPFDFTVLQYSALSSAVSLLGCLGFCAFALFVSAKCRHTAAAVIICLATGYVPFLTYLMIGDEHSALTNILRFAYSQIISVRTLFATNSSVAFGSVKIRTVYLSLTVLLVSTVSLTVWAYKTFRRHQSAN